MIFKKTAIWPNFQLLSPRRFARLLLFPGALWLPPASSACFLALLLCLLSPPCSVWSLSGPPDARSRTIFCTIVVVFVADWSLFLLIFLLCLFFFFFFRCASSPIYWTIQWMVNTHLHARFMLFFLSPHHLTMMGRCVQLLVLWCLLWCLVLSIPISYKQQLKYGFVLDCLIYKTSISPFLNYN